MDNDDILLTDKRVARMLSMSSSWVRGQRHYRQHGKPHTLTVDARYIGTSPRYLKSEIDAFIGEIAA